MPKQPNGPARQRSRQPGLQPLAMLLAAAPRWWQAAEVARVRITAAGRMALADEGCEIPVEMIGLCWLRDSRRRMTQIRRQCPNRTLMTSTSPDLAPP